jgi:hypothetical protein
MAQQKTSPISSITPFLRRSKKTILLIIAVAAVTLVLSASISIILDNNHNISLPSLGNIRTLGVKAYWDPKLKNETTEITWNTVRPGTSYNVTLYLQSISNIKTRLQLQTANWTFRNSNATIVSGPANSTNYMNLKWNYNNTTVNPGQTLKVTLTLSVENSIDFILFLINNNVKQFSFDIIISTSE